MKIILRAVLLFAGLFGVTFTCSTCSEPNTMSAYMALPKEAGIFLGLIVAMSLTTVYAMSKLKK